MASARLSATSPWTISTWSRHSRSARFCGRRVTTRTRKPAASSSGTRRPPMYPVAPVTSTSGRADGAGSVVTSETSWSGLMVGRTSQPGEGGGHAGLGLVAQPFESRFQERREDPGHALEGEVGRVGHLGAGGRCAAGNLLEGHGVVGDDRLVLAAKGDALVRDQLLHDVGQLRLASGEGRGVQVLGPEASVAAGPTGLDRARVPLGGRGEVRQVGKDLVHRFVDGDGQLHSHVCPSGLPSGLRRAMAAFRAVAKATHPAYGISILDAGESTLATRRVRSMVEASSRRISARAHRGRRALKNNQFQPALSTKLAPKAVANARRSPGPSNRSKVRAEARAISP